jgi:hypothetical protein
VKEDQRDVTLTKKMEMTTQKGVVEVIVRIVRNLLINNYPLTHLFYGLKTGEAVVWGPPIEAPPP